MGIIEKVFDLQVTLDEMDWYKDRTNAFSKYDYVSEYVYKQNFKKALIENRMTFKLDEMERKTSYAQSIGANQHSTIITFEACLTDVDTGEFEVYLISGEGSDALDKGGAKAYTQAYKSFISTNFSISGDVDDENNSGEKVLTNIQVTPRELAKLTSDLGKLKADAVVADDQNLILDVTGFIRELGTETKKFTVLKSDRLKEVNKTMKDMETKIKNVGRTK